MSFLFLASESGGERVAEIEFSSMKQPPLIKQLKGILSEYPDGGQILKVTYYLIFYLK